MQCWIVDLKALNLKILRCFSLINLVLKDGFHFSKYKCTRLSFKKLMFQLVGQPVWPYVIHGHYADASDSVALLSGALNVPMVLTGHSLGRNKLEKVLRVHDKRGVNCHGRYMPRMAVISPGMGFRNVVTQEDGPEIDGDLSQLTGGATKSFACNLVRSGAITSCSSWYGMYRCSCHLVLLNYSLSFTRQP
ncbi:sucrose-phosphate synthase [Trifolium repens]|nr:sucrose-phosphate synthase [Trifolium repens]